MPRAKKLSAYPSEYFDIHIAATEHGVVEIPFATEGEAFKFRMELYSFRKALIIAFHEDAEHFDRIRLSVEGSTLILRSPDATPGMNELQGALKRFPPTEPHTENQPNINSTQPPEEEVLSPDAMADALNTLGFTPKGEKK